MDFETVLLVALVCAVVGWAAYAQSLLRRNHDLFIASCRARTELGVVCAVAGKMDELLTEHGIQWTANVTVLPDGKGLVVDFKSSEECADVEWPEELVEVEQ